MSHGKSLELRYLDPVYPVLIHNSTLDGPFRSPERVKRKRQQLVRRRAARARAIANGLRA